MLDRSRKLTWIDGKVQLCLTYTLGLSIDQMILQGPTQHYVFYILTLKASSKEAC